MPPILVHLLPLPTDIVEHIDTFLGGQTYWHARHQLTLNNARLNLFQSDWWTAWHTYFCWYHWHLRNPHCVRPNGHRDTDALTSVNHLPSYCSWIIQEDTRVLLLLRLFRVSLLDEQLVDTLALQLRIHMEYWRVQANHYRMIVYGETR